ncbi:MAG: M14 family metallopeptidase [Armatimonadota bacterium]
MVIRDYQALISRLRAAAAQPNVEMVQIGEFVSCGQQYEMFTLLVGKPSQDKKNAMIDAGIHGDEPAGVEAAIRFVEQNATNDALLERCSFTVFACNNPTGWERNTRENVDGIDLNREFNLRRQAPEARIISDALQGKCFDLVFEMHEDVDSPGFYMYEIAEDPLMYIGEQVIEAVKSIGCPVNMNECIEGADASNGLIRPQIVRFRKTRLPLAIYAWRTCGGHVITLEPPASKLSMDERVRVQLMGLTIALDACAATEQR